MLSQKAWSPHSAGIVIGLLQIPPFLIIETALGASSSYVTVGGLIASWFDPAILKILCRAAVAITARTGGRSRWSPASPSAPSSRCDVGRAVATSPIWRVVRSACLRRAGATRSPFSAASSCCSAPASRTAAPAVMVTGMAQLAVGSTVAVAAMFVGGTPPRRLRCAASGHRQRRRRKHHVRLARRRYGILMGIVFGFALEKSCVFEPGIIVGQMQLRNFIMLAGSFSPLSPPARWCSPCSTASAT